MDAVYHAVRALIGTVYCGTYSEWPCVTSRGCTTHLHLPHLPDLAPSDFHLFMVLHEHFARQCYKNDDQLKAATIAYFENLAGEHYRRGLQKMVKRYKKCLDFRGDYVEK